MRARTVFLPILALCLGGCGVLMRGIDGGRNPVPCTAPGGVEVALIYPQPGATGIPDNIGEVVFAASGGMGQSYSGELQDTTANGATANFNGFTAVSPSTIPSPQATPPFTNPTYYASTNPGYVIPQGHHIEVLLNQASTKCTPTAMGSFDAK